MNLDKTVSKVQPDGSTWNEWGDYVQYTVTAVNPHDYDITGLKFLDKLSPPLTCCSPRPRPYDAWGIATLQDPDDPNDPLAFKCTVTDGECPEIATFTTPGQYFNGKTLWSTTSAANDDWVFKSKARLEVKFWVKTELRDLCYLGGQPTVNMRNTASTRVGDISSPDPNVTPHRNASHKVDVALGRVDPCPTYDLKVSKKRISPEASDWGEITYELTYENFGDIQAEFVVVDYMDHTGGQKPKFTWTSTSCEASDGTSCPTINTRNNRWTDYCCGPGRQRYPALWSGRAKLPGGEKFTITATMNVPKESVCGTVKWTNKATFDRVPDPTVRATESGPLSNSQTVSETPPFARCVDIITRKSQDTSNPTAGVPFNYLLTISNQAGRHTAIDATFTDQLGGYLELVGAPSCKVVTGAAECPATLTGETGEFGELISGVIPELPEGATIQVSIPVQTDFVGSLKNQFTTTPGPDTRDLNTTNDRSSINILATGVGDIWLTKERIPDADIPYIPGDVIAWKIVVGNTGPDNIAGVSVVDEPGDGLTTLEWECKAEAPNSCTSEGEGELFDNLAAIVAGGTIEYTVYGQTDPNREEAVTNTAQATTPSGTTDTNLDNNSDEGTSDPSVPEIELIKSVSEVDLSVAGPIDRPDAGDTITYQFEIHNKADWHLDIDTDSIADDVLAASEPKAVITCPDVLLAPDASVECTATAYTLTQLDIERGGVENSAVVSAKVAYPDGTPVPLDPRKPDELHEMVTDVSDTGTRTGKNGEDPEEVDPDEETENPLGLNTNDVGDPDEDPTTWLVDRVPEVALIKSLVGVDASVAAPDTVIQPGDVAEYRFTVRNTGNIILDQITITDTKLGLVDAECTTGSLAPLASVQCNLTARYVLTQADINNQGVENSATVDSVGVDSEGTVVAESVTDVSDTGTEVTVDDKKPVEIAEPHKAETKNPLGINPNDSEQPEDDPTTLRLTPIPRISLTKAVTSVDLSLAGPADRADAGDTVTYGFEVTNTGNTILNKVALSDAKLDLSDVQCGDTPFALAPGDTVTCDFTTTYVLTNQDIGQGGVENRAIATANPIDTDGNPLPVNVTNPDSNTLGSVTDVSDTASETGTDGGEIDRIDNPGDEETPNPLGENDNDELDNGEDPTTWLFTRKPEIALVKSVVEVDATIAGSPKALNVGDTIKYSFSVTNTGNTHLSDITINDPRIGAIDIACADELAIGDSVDCLATVVYRLTQDDIDDRGIENSATATAKPTDEDRRPLLGDPGNPDAGPMKQISDISDTGSETGKDTDDVELVENPENVETDNPLGVNESTDNDDDPTTWLITPAPGVSLVKSVTRVDLSVAGPADRADVGDIVTFGFEVTNTGSTYLANITFDDPKLGLVEAACDDVVAPGTTVSCTTVGSYVLTQDDLDAGGIENSATVTAEPSDRDGNRLPVDPDDPEGGTLEVATDISDTGSKPGTDTDEVDRIDNPGDEETPNPLGENDNDELDNDDDPTTWLLARRPGIELVKSISKIDLDVVGDGYPDVGDTITYTFSVTNTGNVSLAEVTVDDDKLGAKGVPCVSLLAPGETVDCKESLVYKLQTADIAANGVINTAVAEAKPADREGNLLEIDKVTDKSDTGTESENDDIDRIDYPGAVASTNKLEPGTDTGATGDDPTVALFSKRPASLPLGIPLAFTGASTALMVFTGLALLTLGVILTQFKRRQQQAA